MKQSNNILLVLLFSNVLITTSCVGDTETPKVEETYSQVVRTEDKKKDTEDKKNEAAIKIQKIVRGHLSRKRAKEVKKEKKEKKEDTDKKKIDKRLDRDDKKNNKRLDRDTKKIDKRLRLTTNIKIKAPTQLPGNLPTEMKAFFESSGSFFKSHQGALSERIGISEEDKTEIGKEAQRLIQLSYTDKAYGKYPKPLILMHNAFQSLCKYEEGKTIEKLKEAKEAFEELKEHPNVVAAFNSLLKGYQCMIDAKQQEAAAAFQEAAAAFGKAAA